nr:hypothetical protein [Tanacetum cinerariifolium]
MCLVGSTNELVRDGSTIKTKRSTIPGSVDPSTSQKVVEDVLSPPMSSRSDFVIVRNGLINNKIKESKKPSLKPSLKNGLVKHDSLIWPTIEENGVTRTKKYDELSAIKKIQADCDLNAINIILQGLPFDIYSLVNHHRVAKDLWERISLLMHVNTKFLSSLPSEWSKFVTDVKLLNDLHTTNFDQLHAYLQQHELHANE